MSFSRFLKPSTYNMTYLGQHINFSPDALNNAANQNKFLSNDDDGNLQWIGTNENNGIVRLDGSAKIPTSLLPATFVNDVYTYPNFAAFPPTGVAGKVYVDLALNKQYLWDVNGSMYYLFADISNYFNKTEVTTALNNEASARSTLTTNLATEVTNRTNADTALQGSINTLTTNLATEVTNRTNADTTLQGFINTLTTNLSTEVTNRTNADSNLQSQVTAIQTNAFYKNATGTTTISSNLNMGGNSISSANNISLSGNATALTIDTGLLRTAQLKTPADVTYMEYRAGQDDLLFRKKCVLNSVDLDVIEWTCH